MSAVQPEPRSGRIGQHLAEVRTGIRHRSMPVEGKLTRMVGITLEAKGCAAPIGSQCHITTTEDELVEAEVVGFAEDKLYLMPIGSVKGLTPGARVIPLQKTGEVGVGPDLLGRVIDGAGKPLDDRGEIVPTEHLSLSGVTINPMERAPITTPLDVGVRAINGLLTIGRGQRMGLFAGSGVGKSTLLGVMTRNTEADVVVVGLVGERGREVKEFVDGILGEAGLRKSVIVATPADASPLMRIHGALRATTIAEYFRDQGKKVLLLLDSLTRFAQAQREIALSIGEFPVSKGYPPSVFTSLPLLVERAGNSINGSITAIYTVLVEGDDPNEPIADAARAILDGHVMLSRRVAEQGVYPAIDIEASVSRSMISIVGPEQMKQTQAFKKLYATYQENRDLISVGAYHPGSDLQIDRAIEHYPRLLEYLQQGLNEQVDITRSLGNLDSLTRAFEQVPAVREVENA